MADVLKNVAAVVIGRNEGERLIRCLTSLLDQVELIVYVDSGSTDSSIVAAQEIGACVVNLDLTQPFTAARARNAGADAVYKQCPDIDYIQFVDGDCEVDKYWLTVATQFLSTESEYAVVCGRRRERYPDASVFNLLCDIEWDSPVGDAAACGGDALMRIEAFRSISGFNPELIAGEEPELCYRLRQQNWKIRRVDAEMTLHDAAMTTIGQWWKRAKRAGYAYANSFQLHGQSAEAFKRREVMSIVWWALVFPIIVLVLSVQHMAFSSLFLLYFVQVVKVAIYGRHKTLSFKPAFYYGVSTVGAKWPQLAGIVSFLNNHIKGRRGRLIEYK